MRISLPRLIGVVVLLLLLSIMPLIGPLSALRPFGMLLFVIYLLCTVPKQCSVGLILGLGLLLDALSAGILGQQAFALLLVAYIISKRALRFRLFPMSQQLLGIVALSVGYQLVLTSIQMFWGYPMTFLTIIGPVVMTTLCWPWLQYLFDHLFFTRVGDANLD